MARHRWRIKIDSETRLWIVWLQKPYPQAKTTYHSLDWIHEFAPKKDRDLGIARFEKNFIFKWGAFIEKARIYDAKTNEVLREYKGSYCITIVN